MENREIEIKFKIADITTLNTWLKNNAKLIRNSDQSDFYYDPPHKSFIYINKQGKKSAKEYVRVRIDGSEGYFCYKFINKDLQHLEKQPIEEIETEIKDIKKVIKILEKLDFKHIVTVKKTRISYKYRQFQIDIDQVEKLGNFIEIEYKGKAKDFRTGYKKILDLIYLIGLKNWQEIKSGYAEMMFNTV